MDLSTLQVFIEVMQHGSFAAVARGRNLDPSSVSRTIASLEEELGIRLFQRTTRQLSPTEAGLEYFSRVEPLINELKQAIVATKDISGQPKGILRITASVSFGQKKIVPLLATFGKAYPDLVVDLLLTDAIVDLLAERIDIAVRLGALPDSTLIAQRLIQTRYIVCASPEYIRRLGQPQMPSDLRHHNCLRFPLAGFKSRWIFKNLSDEKYEIPVHGNTIISSAIALQQCAIAGMGIALLPDWLIREDLENGLLDNVFSNYEVTATDFNTAAWLVYPSCTYVPLKVQVFIDFLKNHI